MAQSLFLSFISLLLISSLVIGSFFTGLNQIYYYPAILGVIIMSALSFTPQLFRPVKIPTSALSILVFAFWLYTTLSLLWTSVPFVSLVTYLILTMAPLSFFFAVTTYNETTKRFIMLTVFSFITGLGVWAITQKLFMSDTYGIRAEHPFLNSNTLGGVLSLGIIPLAATLFKTSTSKKVYMGMLLISLFVTVAGLLATQSRGAVILCILCLIFLSTILRQDIDKKVFKLSAVFGCFIIGLLILFLSNSGDGLSYLTGVGTAGNAEESALSRVAIWSNTIPYIKDHLFLGTGLGTFYLYYPSYRLPGLDISSGQWAHMDSLQFWAEMGIMAPLLFYALCIAAILRFKNRFNTLKSNTKIDAASLFTALLFVILHTHITYHLYILPILIITGLYLGYFYILTANNDDFKTITLSKPNKTISVLMWISLLGIFVIMGFSAAWGTYYMNLARYEISQAKADKFIEHITTAEQYAPGSYIEPKVGLAGLYIDLLRQQPDMFFSDDQQKAMDRDVQDNLDYAESVNPAWAEINHKRGLYYKIKGDMDQAINEWEIAIDKNPAHVRAVNEVVDAYIAKGQVDKAYSHANTILSYPIEPNDRNNFQATVANLKPLIDIKNKYLREKNDLKTEK